MTRTDLQALAGRYLDSSRNALGDVAKPIRKALSMPFPLNDVEFELAPKQWSDFLKGCEKRVAERPKWQPKKRNKRR